MATRTIRYASLTLFSAVLLLLAATSLPNTGPATPASAARR